MVEERRREEVSVYILLNRAVFFSHDVCQDAGLII